MSGTKALSPWLPLGKGVCVRLEWKAVDLWVGAYWSEGEAWVCLLPCLPLHFSWGAARG